MWRESPGEDMGLSGQLWAGFLEAEDSQLNMEEPHRSYACHEEESGRAAAQGATADSKGRQ